MRKNINAEFDKELGSNQKKIKLDEANSKTKEIDSPIIAAKGATLKSTSKLSKSIHTRPADEQQLEKNV